MEVLNKFLRYTTTYYYPKSSHRGKKCGNKNLKCLILGENVFYFYNFIIMKFNLSWEWDGKISISGPEWDMKDKLVNWLEKEQDVTVVWIF